MLRQLALLLLLLLAFHGAEAAERGWFGFVAKIDGETFSLNPKISRITISKVIPDSPAAKGSLQAGDEVIAVEGHTVAGARANELKPLIEKPVGDSLHLKLKHQNGQTFDAVLVATTKPK